jgi:hypothetical protein
LRIAFPYLGLFPGSNLVGFLGVAHSEDLMALHAEAFREVEGCYKEVDGLYRPSVLVMHSTLALAIPGERLSAYWRVVTDALLPEQAIVEGIDIVEYFPAQTKASLPFGGK